MPNANKIIYSLRIYLELEKKGIYPITTTANPRKPNFMCWIYEKTPELVQALDELMGEK
jgi:hypothetical protein